jgi:GTP-binding protein
MKVHHRAGDGTNGRGDSRHGQKGADIIIPVPPGTIVRDQVNSLNYAAIVFS